MHGHYQNRDIRKTVLEKAAIIHINLPGEYLIEAAIQQPEVSQTNIGTIVANTGKYSELALDDKFIVEDVLTKNSIYWERTGKMLAKTFNILLHDMLKEIGGKTAYYQQLQIGTQTKNCYTIDFFSPSAWHSLFIQNLLIEPASERRNMFNAKICILHLPEFKANPGRHGCKTETCIALDLSRNIILICGTAYAGEIKEAVLSLFSFHAPQNDVLPMHCSANVGNKGDTALFFGVSGTGQTILSLSPDRTLVGDGEHGWSREGIFNLEGGSYAKAISLNIETEPEIFKAAKYPSAILENVVLDSKTGEPNFDDCSLTENTRISYPLAAIPKRLVSGIAQAPRNVVFLTSDAFGVLPSISRLTREQAVYYFLSGYSAKIDGTESSIPKPHATFSACSGADSIVRLPSDYGNLLDTRLQESGARCWLLNYRWTGAPCGIRKRIPLSITRRILKAVLSGELDNVECRIDEIFELEVPISITGIQSTFLIPEKTWADTAAYTTQAKKLVRLFAENYHELAINDVR